IKTNFSAFILMPVIPFAFVVVPLVVAAFFAARVPSSYSVRPDDHAAEHISCGRGEAGNNLRAIDATHGAKSPSPLARAGARRPGPLITPPRIPTLRPARSPPPRSA